MFRSTHAGHAGRRVAADPSNAVRRRRRQPVRAGVFRRAAAGPPRSREFRPPDSRRPTARRAPHGDRWRNGPFPRRRGRQKRNAPCCLGADAPIADRIGLDVHGCPARDRCRVDAAPSSRCLGASSRDGCDERVARGPRPEPHPRMALQLRQSVRGVLVPGGSRRRPGDGRVGTARPQSSDHRALVDATPASLPELEAGRAAARSVNVLPPLLAGPSTLWSAGARGARARSARARSTSSRASGASCRRTR